jgi:hypothetical protein
MHLHADVLDDACFLARHPIPVLIRRTLVYAHDTSPHDDSGVDDVGTEDITLAVDEAISPMRTWTISAQSLCSSLSLMTLVATGRARTWSWCGPHPSRTRKFH